MRRWLGILGIMELTGSAQAAEYYVPDGVYMSVPSRAAMLMSASGEINRICFAAFMTMHSKMFGGMHTEFYVIDFDALGKGIVRYLKAQEAECYYDETTQLDSCKVTRQGRRFMEYGVVGKSDGSAQPFLYSPLSEAEYKKWKVTGEMRGSGEPEMQFSCNFKFDISKYIVAHETEDIVGKNVIKFLGRVNSDSPQALTPDEFDRLVNVLAE